LQAESTADSAVSIGIAATLILRLSSPQEVGWARLKGMSSWSTDHKTPPAKKTRILIRILHYQRPHPIACPTLWPQAPMDRTGSQIYCLARTHAHTHAHRTAPRTASGMMVVERISSQTGADPKEGLEFRSSLSSHPNVLLPSLHAMTSSTLCPLFPRCRLLCSHRAGGRDKRGTSVAKRHAPTADRILALIDRNGDDDRANEK
jgi:hypothetical protein